MTDSELESKDSVTDIAGESFVRERALDIERGAVLAGRYQIEEIIGKGGSGVVLRAFDRTAETVVALKVLKAELARDAKWERRFSRELRIGRPIQHPNVCRIFDIGEADGHRFLTMELATGGSLRDELKRRGADVRTFADRMSDAEAAIAGLAAIHGAGIVHRDFKPDNLLRMEDGRLVLSDFGLATDAANAPGTTVMIGTPHYMAPEILAGEPATTRSDVWALGVVLHEIFFGRRPERRGVGSTGAPKPTKVTPGTIEERAMAAFCEECLAESPTDRPTDARAALSLLEEVRGAPRSWVGRRSPFRSRVAVAILSALAALALAVGLARRNRKDSPVGSSDRPRLALITPVGTGDDLSRSASTVATIAGKVHCFSAVDDRTVRIVWGEPRRAEDIDVSTGARRPSALAPEAYQAGCPEVNPRTKAILFAAFNPAGVSEIRLSNRPDGRSATTITSGFDPLWLRDGETFVYNADRGHAAVFSIPAMSSTFLEDPGLSQHQIVFEKAVDRRADAVALLVSGDGAETAIAIYEGGSLDRRGTFLVPTGYRLMFDPNDRLLFSTQGSQPGWMLSALDWHDRAAKGAHYYPGFDLLDVQPVGDVTVVLARRIAKDVWSYDRSGKRRLTFDGENYSAAMAPNGDLLLSRRGAFGAMSIWLQSPSGKRKQITFGEVDVSPAFSPDGKRWTYVDYRQKSVMVCDGYDVPCRVLRRDDNEPELPSFSPDGTKLAYMTNMGFSKVSVLSVTDGGLLQSWGAHLRCGPIWASDGALWTFETAAGRFFWAKRDPTTGKRLGETLEARGEGGPEGRCFSADPSSPFFARVDVQTDETSKIFRLPAGESLR